MADLACAHCGATDDFWAWYDAPERQSIALEGVGTDGSVRYDYTGCTDSGDSPGGDYGYYCGSCCTYAESLEALVGLPEVPGVSTLAALFAEGQRIPELDDDDFTELCDIVLEEVKRRRSGGDVAIVNVVDISEIRRACGYDPDDESSIDSLIDYKDTLEDIVMEYATREEV